MASEDPRALLRAARKERRVAHPHASYTSTGNLLCNLCEVPIKSEAAWGAHLHSTGHTLRLSREQDAAIARKTEASTSKKRKAGTRVDGEDGDVEERKRAKGAEAGDAISTHVPAAPQPTPQQQAAPGPESKGNEQADLDALEADLAAMEREHRANEIKASATIAAPAQTAEEIAAQAREEQSAQRGRRDAELEEEREDAARALEEEFAEMQTLEDRVKKLREKREMLRAGRGAQAGEGATQDGGGLGGQLNGGNASGGTENGSDDKDDGDASDDDEDDDDDGFDDWTFGAR